jgi:hypothetical protein
MSSTTEGFGAPTAFGAHHFIVDIPVAPRDPVKFIEDFGFNGQDGKRETTECRVILARELWSAIREQARVDFNERLKKKKSATGSWSTGKNKLDRFLGRELCVLAWAAEHASVDECGIICQKWAALRPEERWWLYAKTAAEAGGDKDTNRGWRKALYCSLSDGTNIKLAQKVQPKNRKTKTEDPLPNLFDFIEG